MCWSQRWAPRAEASFEAASNGGEALSQIAGYYFGTAGALILAATVTVACLKTAVGLITSCGKTFVKLFPGGPSYPVWAVGFCVLSFLIANLGLDAIILPIRSGCLCSSIRWQSS